MKQTKTGAWILIGMLLLSGCSGGNISSGSETESVTEEAASSSTTSALSTMDLSEMFTDRDMEIGYEEADSTKITLADDASSCDSDAVLISENTITITEEGTYILSGTLTDGMVIVEAGEEDKVQLVLDDAEITSAESAAIYVTSADKVVVTTAVGSENKLENGGSYTAIDENNIDAVIFSKADLTLNGAGELEITATAGHGVVSKDDLALTSGTYEITAESHGLSGKDSVRIAGGTVTISAGKDGIHASNADDASLGFVYIADGMFEIHASDDGIHADSEVMITGGTIEIAQSYEGIEGLDIDISGGDITVVSSDDGLNAAGGNDASGGEADNGKESFPEMGAMAEGEMPTAPAGAEVAEGEMPTAPDGTEMAEGEMPTAPDGTEMAEGEMPTAPDGTEMQREEIPGGGDAMETEEDAWIQISGGTLHVNASGDGIDSNGSIYITGGETYVSGPTTGGNGNMDYGIEAVVTGGIFVAAGTSDMAQNFSSSSTQGIIMVTVDTQAAGSEITLTDSSQEELLSWTNEKQYNFVLISCPEIVQGQTYTLTAGTDTQEITMESLIYEKR